MTPKEQAKFVHDLCHNVEVGIVEDIREGRVPEDWDGIELRELLARRFAAASYRQYLKGPRRRDFENTLIVANL